MMSLLHGNQNNAEPYYFVNHTSLQKKAATPLRADSKHGYAIQIHRSWLFGHNAIFRSFVKLEGVIIH
jgi:hypothetical protein